MAPAPNVSQQIIEAQNLSKGDPKRAEELYKDILSNGPESGDATLHTYEAALIGLGKLYRDTKRPNELAELVRTSRSTLSSFAKAKTAKLGMGRFHFYGYLSIANRSQFASYLTCSQQFQIPSIFKSP